MIRKLCEKDACGMLEWMHDERVNKYFRFNAANTSEQEALEFVRNSWDSADQGKSYHFAIVNDFDEYVGTISLKEIDSLAKTAEYAISLIHREQGKGFAYTATIEILDFAFKKLNLNRVYLNVLSENDHAVKFYEKCGFHFEGEFEQHVFVNGELKSLKWFAVLREKYLEEYHENNAEQTGSGV